MSYNRTAKRKQRKFNKYQKNSSYNPHAGIWSGNHNKHRKRSKETAELTPVKFKITPMDIAALSMFITGLVAIAFDLFVAPLFVLTSAAYAGARYCEHKWLTNLK